MAKGYSEKEGGIKLMDYYRIEGMGPAGSINASAAEMANWLIAWINGGKEAVMNNELPGWVRFSLVAALILPAVTPLRQLRSYDYGDEISTLLVLTDKTEAEAKSFDMLPDSATVDTALTEIQAAVNEYQEVGDVLFMDQRQLLTFDYIHEAKFGPEYEKKVLMNEALSTNYE